MADRPITGQDIKAGRALDAQFPVAFNDGSNDTNDRFCPEILNHLYDITALTGGGADALDSLSTIELVDLLVAALPNGYGSPNYGPLYHLQYEGETGYIVDLMYRFTKSTEAENSPFAIRPDDFASQATNYVFRLAAPPVGNGVHLIVDPSDVTKWYELTSAAGGGGTETGIDPIVIV